HPHIGIESFVDGLPGRVLLDRRRHWEVGGYEDVDQIASAGCALVRFERVGRIVVEGVAVQRIVVVKVWLRATRERSVGWEKALRRTGLRPRGWARRSRRRCAGIQQR